MERQYIPGPWETIVHPDGSIERHRDVIDVTVGRWAGMVGSQTDDIDREEELNRDECPKCGQPWYNRTWHPGDDEHVLYRCACGFTMKMPPLDAE